MPRTSHTAAGAVATAATLLLAFAGAAAALLAAPDATAAPRVERWSAEERATLASMRLAALPAPPADPSNAVAAHPGAIALGRRLFADTRLSRNGEVACATCHAAERDFQDGRSLGQGVATGRRRTMPIAASLHGPWWFWDGRKDSLWSQALGPLEDAAEHGANRLQLVQLLGRHYRADYEAVFGPLPPLQGLPMHAGPQGTADEQTAWAALTPAQRDGIDRAFANLGKAIAAYERTIAYREARFDRYVEAVLRQDVDAQQAAMTPQEVRGLRLFIGKAQCGTCHQGPLLTDHAFHNTGVPSRTPARPDRGRAAAIAAVRGDTFNCLGRHSDAPKSACGELEFIAADDPATEGAFKTPTLRNVAERAPYMHAGQFASLEDVVAHYARSPKAPVGHSELAHEGGGHAGRLPIRLNDEEMRDLVAFLRTLGGAAK